MKFRKVWLMLLLLPVGSSIYWLAFIQPYIQIENARLAASIIEVRTDIPGTLSFINKEEGSWVEKGEILFSFNAAQEKADLEQLQMRLDDLHQMLSGHLAEAEAAMQEYLNARSEEALGLQVLSDQPLTRLGQQQNLAEKCRKEMSDIGQKIEIAKTLMERKSFSSPISGFLIERKKEKNEELIAGDLVCSLCNSKEIWIDALVPESAASKIKLGQKAIAMLPFDSSFKWPGVISWISPMALPNHEGIPVRISLKEGYPDCFRPNLQIKLSLKVR